MADLEVRPKPGQDVVVLAPAGKKLLKATYNSTQTRARIKNTGVPVVDPVPPTDPDVEPPSIATSVPMLLAMLGNNAITDIVVKNGRYPVSPASNQSSNSLWIGGGAIAARTNPVTVRAETKGGVIFDGGGASYFGGITFVDGAHHQTWDGFSFDNGKPTQSGCIVIGAYGKPAAHHLTLRNISILPGVVGSTPNNDHALYFSKDACHDILIEDYSVNTPVVPAGQNGIKSALQFYHAPNAYNVTVRRMHVKGTMSAILIYEATATNILIEDVVIENARDAGLNVDKCGVVTIRNVQSNKGTYFPSGKPAGLTMENCTWG